VVVRVVDDRDAEDLERRAVRRGRIGRQVDRQLADVHRLEHEEPDRGGVAGVGDVTTAPLEVPRRRVEDLDFDVSTYLAEQLVGDLLLSEHRCVRPVGLR
jgi:hypothetical protein